MADQTYLDAIARAILHPVDTASDFGSMLSDLAGPGMEAGLEAGGIDFPTIRGAAGLATYSPGYELFKAIKRQRGQEEAARTAPAPMTPDREKALGRTAMQVGLHSVPPPPLATTLAPESVNPPERINPLYFQGALKSRGEATTEHASDVPWRQYGAGGTVLPGEPSNPMRASASFVEGTPEQQDAQAIDDAARHTALNQAKAQEQFSALPMEARARIDALRKQAESPAGSILAAAEKAMGQTREEFVIDNVSRAQQMAKQAKIPFDVNKAAAMADDEYQKRLMDAVTRMTPHARVEENYGVPLPTPTAK